ncbi:MAG: hypothetical protein MUE85_03685 [Microscillaceae bacterium]|jgi:hypothetical protein|nr:hypothetical protein [Microscillaceae bacterium]
MEKSPLHKVIILFQQSFHTLSVEISNPGVERLALLVHNSMSGERRKFHAPAHVIHVCQHLSNPLQVLAGLFHDVVYFQVDGGFPLPTRILLDRYVEIQNNEVNILPEVPQETLFDLALGVFGFELGQKLSPIAGLNEFLSTLVAVKELEKYLPTSHLLTIMACLEATIPFRMSDESGKTHFEKLADRLKIANDKYDLNLNETEIDEIIKLAVEIANQDVLNFSDQDTGRFLDNTWLLLFESNNILSNLEGHTYSIVKYRQALMKTEGFIRFLNPLSIFHEYKGFPDAQTFAYLNQQAERNVKIAREYLGLKVLSATVLEALAMTTGGDAPMALLTGGIRTADNMIERAEDYLPALQEAIHTDYDEAVLNLLEYGRASETHLDMKNSPLSAFIYKSLGSRRCTELLAKAQDLFAEKIDYSDFLHEFDRPVLAMIAQACAHIALTRQTALKKYFITV